MTDNRIGAKLTTLRESLGLSIDELAGRSGCDAATIARLESGAIAPSLAPLITITRALGVRLGTLLDDDTNVARVKSLETSSDGGVLDFFSLAQGKASRHMEPFVITVNPTEASDHKLSSHEGEEFIYVLEGEIDVEYGKDVVVLGAGDSIYYDSIVPHQVRAVAAGPARILAVVYAPA
jgi:transcriptional regulator with XRE-family HTH domain